MKSEFPEGFFQKKRPEATHDRLADISEPMQVDDDVLSGKKKLILTTRKELIKAELSNKGEPHEKPNF